MKTSLKAEEPGPCRYHVSLSRLSTLTEAILLPPSLQLPAACSYHYHATTRGQNSTNNILMIVKLPLNTNLDIQMSTPSQLNSTLNYKNYLSLYCATGFSIWVCMGNKSWKTGWAWHYSKTELFVKPESEVPKSRQKGLGLTLTNHTCCSTSLLISIWRSSCTYYHNTPHHIIHS